MQILNISVKDAARVRFNRSVAHWTDSARSRNYNGISGAIKADSTADCKVVLVTFNDDLMNDIISLANSAVPMSLVNVEVDATATVAHLQGLQMYDIYHVSRAPTIISGGIADLVPAKFNPPATTYNQVSSRLQCSNLFMTVSLYFTKLLATAQRLALCRYVVLGLSIAI